MVNIAWGFIAYLAFLWMTFRTAITVQAQCPPQVVNAYAAVVAIDTTCLPVLTLALGSPTFIPGDEVVIIQHKGATITESNDANFGRITALNGAGNYEFNEVKHFSDNQLTLRYGLLRSYDPDFGVQVVKVSKHAGNAVFNCLVTAPIWNGSTGGIIAIHATGEVILNAGLDASGRGYNNGRTSVNNFGECDSPSYFFGINTGFGGTKGEGVAQYIRNKEAGRGPNGNGGGGGNAHNAGGAGGANGGNGGLGGCTWANCNDDRISQGIGGYAVRDGYTQNKIFFGGGGGGGHQNDNVASSGGIGGGIVIIKAKKLTTPYIYADGAAATSARNDGAGGGGGGGTILLDVDEFSAPFTLRANGGKGGNNSTQWDVCHGTGGGGGGGVIWFKQATVPELQAPNVNGGDAGRVTHWSLPCFNTTYCATAGSRGVILFNLKLPYSTKTMNFSAGTISTDTDKICGMPTRLININSANTPNARYLWQFQVPGGQWRTVPCPDSSQQSLTLCAAGLPLRACDSLRFRRRAFISNCDTFTRSITVTRWTINAGEIAGQTSICDSLAEPFENIRSCTACGTNLVYQWQQQLNGVWDNLPNSNTARYYPSYYEGRRCFRRICRGSGGCTDTSNIICLIRNRPPAFTVVPFPAGCDVNKKAYIEIRQDFTSETLLYTLTGPQTQNGTVTPPLTRLEDLKPGSYCLEIAAGACVSRRCFEMPEPAPISAVVTDSGCVPNVKATVSNLKGGSGNYQYRILSVSGWQNSPRFNITTEGSYTFQIRDRIDTMCIFTVQRPLVITAITPAFRATQPTRCTAPFNGQIEITRPVGAGVAVRLLPHDTVWRTNPPLLYSNLPPGPYRIQTRELRNPSCIEETSVFLGQPAGPNFQIFASGLRCAGINDGRVRLTPTNLEYRLNPEGQWTRQNDFQNLIPGFYYIYARHPQTPDCISIDSIRLAAPPKLTLTSDVINLRCSNLQNGGIVLYPDGGSGQYRYSIDRGHWQSSNSFLNLGGGRYVVGVQDAVATECTLFDTVTVNAPQNLRLTKQIVKPSCNDRQDGQIIVRVTGGTKPYVFQLATHLPLTEDSIFRHVASGRYVVTVSDARNCELRDTIAVESVEPISFSLEIGRPRCNNSNTGYVLVRAKGGSGQYNYVLDTFPSQPNLLFAALPAGNYTMTVRDNLSPDCYVTQRFHIAPIDSNYLDVKTVSPTCFGARDGKLRLSYNPVSNGYEVLVNNVVVSGNEVSNLRAGVYEVVHRNVAFPECIVSKTITLTQPNPLTAGVQTLPLFCPGQSSGRIRARNVRGGTPPYRFSLNDQNYQSSPNFYGLSTGVYTLFISDSNNCKLALENLVIEPVIDTTLYIETDAASCLPTGGIRVFDQKDGELLFAESGLEAGNYEFSFTALPGCVRTVRAKIDLVAAIDAGPDKEIQLIQPICVPEPVMLSGFPAGGRWLPGDSLSKRLIIAGNKVNFREYGGLFRYQGQWDFTLKYLLGGCVDSIRITVKSPGCGACNLPVPNVFTPNGDGVNDEFSTPFSLLSLSKIPYRVSIFDRWGKLVYEGTNGTPYWDGRLANGGLAPEGVYTLFMTCEDDGGTTTRATTVTLLR